MHDLFKIQRYYSQTEFVAYQMAQMLQTVSQNRSDKKITWSDLKRVTAAAYLSIYPGTTMFWQGKGHVFGHFPHPMVYYVKGLSNGNASCIWRAQMHPSHEGNTSPSNMNGAPNNHDDYNISAVRYKTDVPPAQIYPTLKIKPGEVKIIVDALIYYQQGSYFPFADGQTDVSVREAFGLYLVTPKVRRQNPASLSYNQNCGYFNSVVIFSPNPGLFDETPPQ